MKKIKFTIIMLLLSILLITPSFTAQAESSKEIYYPVGISDYVDLNNVKLFTMHDNKVFYTKADNKVICYDKSTKSSTLLESAGTIFNLVVEGDYLFIFTSSGTTYAYNLDTLTSKSFSSFSSAYYSSAINVNYVNNKYYFAFVGSSPVKFNVWVMNNDLTFNKQFTYSTSFDSSYVNSFVTLSDNLIALKPKTGDTIYLFNYPTTELTPIESGSSNPYFRINGFDDSTTTTSVSILESEGSYSNTIFISYQGGTNTEVCKFNGSSLTCNSDNNLIYDKICINDSKLYVYNSNNANIATYEYNITNDTFTFKELILAGKGSEKGRFKDVSDLTYKSGTLYVTDSGNKRIQILSDSSPAPEDRTGTITEVVVDSDDNYYYVDVNGTTSTLYKNGSPKKAFYNKNIISLAINLDNTLYALTSDGKVIHYIDNNNCPEIELSKTVKTSSKIRINNNYLNFNTPISSIVAESRINVSVDNFIYRFNPTNGALEKTLTFDTNIIDFKFNGAVASTPVYVLLSNGDFIKSSFTESSDKNVTLEGFNDYSAFSMDITTGEFQMYNKNLSAIEIYTNTEFSSQCTLTHYDEKVLNSNGFTEVWRYANIKEKAKIYDYYYFIGNYSASDTITNVIVINANEEFAYVGYTSNNKLKFGYVKITDLVDGIKPMALSDKTYKLRTTNKNVSVFKYPSIYNDLSFYTFAQGDIITTYGKYVSSIDNNEYYIVKIGSTYGYICSKDVVLNENVSRSIRTNAKIKIFDGSDKVSVYLTAEDGSSVLCKLPDGYKINVENYDKNAKYTKITFVDEDQQEREGYVLTSYVKLNGLSNAVITALVLLALDIIIAVIVIVFFVHYKKKQKAKNNNLK